MKQVSAEELAGILNKSSRKMDFILELGILQEARLCVKPVYKFVNAYVMDEKTPEFCLIYSEADDRETIIVSISSLNSLRFDEILKKYKIYKTIYHGENGDGDFYESFYFDSTDSKDIENIQFLNFRLLNVNDKNLVKARSGDDYLNVIFEDFIEKKLWLDCGIIGAFDENNVFSGYLAYYEIAENVRDVSYIYIKPEHRRMGYAKKLLKYFKNKNIQENKISYYSYAENDISKAIVQACGFTSCAERYENGEVM